MKTTTMFIRAVDVTVRDQFKGMCAVRGDTMQDVFEALMRAYIKEPGKFNVLPRRQRVINERKAKPTSMYTEDENSPRFRRS